MQPYIQRIPEMGAWFQQHPMALLYVFGGMLGLMLLVKIIKALRGAQKQLTTHGSARLATAREVRRSGLSTKHGVVIGEVD